MQCCCSGGLRLTVFPHDPKYSQSSLFHSAELSQLQRDHIFSALDLWFHLTCDVGDQPTEPLSWDRLGQLQAALPALVTVHTHVSAVRSGRCRPISASCWLGRVRSPPHSLPRRGVAPTFPWHAPGSAMDSRTVESALDQLAVDQAEAEAAAALPPQEASSAASVALLPLADMVALGRDIVSCTNVAHGDRLLPEELMWALRKLGALFHRASALALELRAAHGRKKGWQFDVPALYPSICATPDEVVNGVAGLEAVRTLQPRHTPSPSKQGPSKLAPSNHFFMPVFMQSKGIEKAVVATEVLARRWVAALLAFCVVPNPASPKVAAVLSACR